MPPNAHSPWGNQWWFTDEFADGPRRLMDAFWAVPEWAPADESHLVGSQSVVTKIAYGRGSVTYSTFDPASVDVLRLNFVPESVWSGGRKLDRRGDLKQEGYTFDDATRVLRLWHDHARDVDIQGSVAEPVPLIVDFDNPHVGANVKLRGQYPSGVIDWGDAQWKVCPPGGRMSTFSLGTAETDLQEAHFRFFYPRVLVHLDVYNPLPQEVKHRSISCGRWPRGFRRARRAPEAENPERVLSQALPDGQSFAGSSGVVYRLGLSSIHHFWNALL